MFKIKTRLLVFLGLSAFGLCPIEMTYAVDEARGTSIVPAIAWAEGAALRATERAKYYQEQITKYENQKKLAKQQITEQEAKKSVEQKKTPPGDTTQIDRQIQEAKQKLADAEKALTEADPNHGKDIPGLGKDVGENKGLEDKLCEAEASMVESENTARELQKQHDLVNQAKDKADVAAKEAQAAEKTYREKSSDSMIPGEENQKAAEKAYQALNDAQKINEAAQAELLEHQGKLVDLAKPFELKEGIRLPNESNPGSRADSFLAVAEGRASPGPELNRGLQSMIELANDPQGTAAIRGRTNAGYHSNSGEAWIDGKMVPGRYFDDKRGGGRYFVPDSAYNGKGLDGYVALGSNDISGLYQLNGKIASGGATKLPNGGIQFKGHFDGKQYYSGSVWQQTGNRATLVKTPFTRDLTSAPKLNYAPLKSSQSPAVAKFNPFSPSTWSWGNFMNLFSSNSKSK